MILAFTAQEGLRLKTQMLINKWNQLIRSLCISLPHLPEQSGYLVRSDIVVHKLLLFATVAERCVDPITQAISASRKNDNVD
jgi:hypothetical protein